ncbi:unnamed protein product [Soboliphyme baturini]|uniref:Large ribosomal subunit protein uL16m n=1 Tax=Soboliphyme baturini TaxID=241478 RepID=A0A183IU44_9BILA|nr:unnamed protein product [Soboliphyme baturini]
MSGLSRTSHYPQVRNPKLQTIEWVKQERITYLRLFSLEKIYFPPSGERQLPQVPKVPVFDASVNEVPKKHTKRLIEIRGPELVHTKLIHQQYGVRALVGGFMHYHNFETIRKMVNYWIKDDKKFAIWRVDAPWLPRTKVPQGLKLGGGKRSIHHYVTPVRAKRIVMEYGGFVSFEEVLLYFADVSMM